MLKKTYSKTKPVCKVTFTLPVEAAPDAEKVALLGDFNDWNAQQGPEMKKQKGYYEATLELEAGRRYEFRYLIDGKRWENDWDADGYVPSPFTGITNSVLILEAVAVEAPAQKEQKPASKPASKKEPVKAEAKPVAKKEAPKTAAKPAAKQQAPKAEAKTVKPASTAKPAKSDLKSTKK